MHSLLDVLRRACLVVLVPLADAALAASSTAAPAIVWAKQFGTPAEDHGQAIAVDAGGRSYVAGVTAGDLGAANAGKKDAFVAAFDSGGERRWIRQFGTPEDDEAVAILCDVTGALFVAGSTSGELEPGRGGGMAAFVAQLDRDGQTAWLCQIDAGGADAQAGETRGTALARTKSGDLVLTGFTDGLVGEEQAGDSDGFVLMLSPTGERQWVRQWGSAGSDRPGGVAVAPDGSIYVTGKTTGSLATANAGRTDVFVTKLDPAGRLVWTRQFGTPDYEMGMEVAVGADGGLYVGASSAGDLAAAQRGGGDAVLIRLSAAGDVSWQRQFGTTRWDGVHGLVLTPGAAEHILAAGCQNWDQCQAFLRAFDSAGHELWSLVIPSEQTVCGTQIAIDAAGDIYQTGGTHGPAFGDYTGAGGDVVLVKFGRK